MFRVRFELIIYTLFIYLYLLTNGNWEVVFFFLQMYNTWFTLSSQFH